MIPEEGAENRVTCDGRLGDLRDADGGRELGADRRGAEPAWVAVLREGMSQDDEARLRRHAERLTSMRCATARSWIAAENLPPILSVEAAALQ